MTLYDINAELRELLEIGFTEDCVDEETGEVREDLLQAKWEAIVVDEKEKIEATLVVAREFEARAKAKEEEIARLKSLMGAEKYKAEQLRKRVSAHLLSTGRRQYDTNLFHVSHRKSTKVYVENPNALRLWAEATGNQNVLVEKVEYSVAKEEVKRLLKDGVDIPGATLVENDNIQVK